MKIHQNLRKLINDVSTNMTINRNLFNKKQSRFGVEVKSRMQWLNIELIRNQMRVEIFFVRKKRKTCYET